MCTNYKQHTQMTYIIPILLFSLLKLNFPFNSTAAEQTYLKPLVFLAVTYRRQVIHKVSGDYASQIPWQWRETNKQQS